MNNESNDYKRGWYDGFQAAMKQMTDTQRHIPHINPYPTPIHPSTRCGTCGIEFGNKTWGYVCNHQNCPSKITAQVSYTFGGAGTTGATGSLANTPIGGAGANGPSG